MPTKPKHMPRLRRRKIYSKQSHYRKYRNEIREDCECRCAYCDVHELEAGGAETMTLDHFRPKKKYPKLEHEPTNLVWACSPCNQLKGNDWPAYGLSGSQTVNGEAGYIDPFISERNDFFEIKSDGSLLSKQVPGQYMIYSLALNRPFLRYIRKRRELIYESLKVLEDHFEAEIEMFNTILQDDNMTDLDKGRWLQDKQRFEAFLDLILALDETFKLE